MQLKVHIEHDASLRGTAIYLYGEDNKGRFVIEPVTLVARHYSEGEMLGSPTFVFGSRDGEEFLQALSQALVRIGFKPDELKQSNEQVVAIKYHLEDMRKLVFNIK